MVYITVDYSISVPLNILKISLNGVLKTEAATLDDLEFEYYERGRNPVSPNHASFQTKTDIDK